MHILYVYTMYTLFFMAFLIVCVIAAVLLGTYLAVKVKKNAVFFAYLLIQAALLLITAAKLLQLVSPVASTADAYLLFQKTILSILIPLLFLFPAVLLKCNKDKKPVLISLIFTAAAAGAASAGLQTVTWTADNAPACAMLIWMAFVFLWRKDIFASLSELSVDTFMDKTEDAVLIFDRARKLIDRNRKAGTIFPFLNAASTAGELFEEIGGKTETDIPRLSLEDNGAGPPEFGMRDGTDIRYLQLRTAEVKKKDGTHMETIATFHDVTERTRLLSELEEKNRELLVLNEELQRYIDVTCLLEHEAEKERSWALIQEEIARSIAGLLAEMEALEALEDIGDETAAERLDQMIRNCRTVMSAIRKYAEH